MNCKSYPRLHSFTAIIAGITFIWTFETSSSQSPSELDYLNGNNNCSYLGSKCSQICSDSGCFCLPGFKVGSNAHSCQATDPSWKILLASDTWDARVGYIERDDNGEMRDTMVFSNLRNGSTRATELYIKDITYDARNRLVYWAARDLNSNKKIFYKSINLNESARSPETVGFTDLEYTRALALDWITGNLYVADDRRILACQNDPYLCGVVIEGVGVGIVFDLALHPNLGIMFWSQSSGGLMRSGMDGSSQVQISTSAPHALAVDQGNGRIYWGDYWLGIQSSNFDGSDKQDLPNLDTQSTRISSLDIFGDTLFWTSSKRLKYTVQSANKFLGGKTVLWNGTLNDTFKFEYLAIFHVANQPILRSNPCKNNSECEHVCVLSPTGFGCICPEGQELAGGGTACIFQLTSERVNYIILTGLFLICVVAGIVLLIIFKRTKRSTILVKARIPQTPNFTEEGILNEGHERH